MIDSEWQIHLWPLWGSECSKVLRAGSGAGQVVCDRAGGGVLHHPVGVITDSRDDYSHHAEMYIPLKWSTPCPSVPGLCANARTIPVKIVLK